VTSELDLTPDEINDPQMMQLWVAPFGTPLPKAWSAGMDMAFRFVGMVARDGKAHFRDADLVDPFDESRDRGPVAMTLTWHRMLRKRAIFLPVGRYCSAIFAMPAPAHRQLGVAPRVKLEGFDLDHRGGASCTAVLEMAAPYRTSLEWYVGAPVLAAS
jgi:hypothetical protein